MTCVVDDAFALARPISCCNACCLHLVLLLRPQVHTSSHGRQCCWWRPRITCWSTLSSPLPRPSRSSTPCVAWPSGCHSAQALSQRAVHVCSRLRHGPCHLRLPVPPAPFLIAHPGLAASCPLAQPSAQDWRLLMHHHQMHCGRSHGQAQRCGGQLERLLCNRWVAVTGQAARDCVVKKEFRAL